MNNYNKVTIHFCCRADGHIIDSTYDREPFEITIGNGELIEGVEEQILEMQLNDKREIVIDKSKAFGDISKDLIKVVELERIPKEANIGDLIDGETEDGTKFQCILRDIDVANNIAIMDFNHPLAGKDLVFEVELLKVD